MFVETYSVADRVWELTTNSADLMAAARESFPDGPAAAGSSPDLRLDINVADTMGSGAWRRPVCRGRDHLAFCCIGDESAILFDYRKRTATGSVTRAVAAETGYWREVVFPFTLGVMAPVLNAVPLHAACFRYRNRGVLIGARSGAGKSTLAATLARRGIEFISDDWVYLTANRGLRAHALPVPLKLLPDARGFFPELQSMVPAESQNGEWSIAVDPAETFGSPRGYRCEPETVLLFDRTPGADLLVRRARTEELLDWFSEPLDCVPTCLEEQREEQIALIRALGRCHCYVVTCDGTPEEIADNLLCICRGEIVVSDGKRERHKSGIKHLDLLRRATPLPNSRITDIAGSAVAISTNHRSLLHQFAPAAAENADFEITVIVETEPWPGSAPSFRHQENSVGCVSFGTEGLMVFDGSARKAAAFVSEPAVRDGRVSYELLMLCTRLSYAATVTT